VRAGDISRVLGRIGRANRGFVVPAVTAVAARRDPFAVLVSTILSLRTKDEVTAAASARLLARAPAPAALLRLPARSIERLIYPVGFYRVKARHLREVARLLLARHGGRVPADLDLLLELPGVGRKVANLVLVLGFGLPGVCVDTHVHRICNRLGYVRTRDPLATEMALRRKLPRRHWLTVNDLLVTFGQNVCGPLSPRCSTCPVARHCARVGVTRSR
jgi:endonuclease III